MPYSAVSVASDRSIASPDSSRFPVDESVPLDCSEPEAETDTSPGLPLVPSGSVPEAIMPDEATAPPRALKCRPVEAIPVCRHVPPTLSVMS